MRNNTNNAPVTYFSSLATGHYLSPGGGGRGRRILRGGSLKTLEGFRGGTTQICAENEDMGGIRESHQMLLGGSLQ